MAYTDTARVADVAAAAARARMADEVGARLDRLPFTGLHRRTCGTIALGTFFDSFDSLIIAAALTAIVSSLHINFTQIGLIISAAYLGMAVGAPLFGWLAELIGRKPVCVWMIAGFGVLSILAAFAWDFQSLLIVRLIEGLALGGQVPVSAALYSEFLPKERRGRGFFYGYTVMFSTGIFLAPLVGLLCFTLFGPELGWRVLFLTGGFAIAVAIYAQYALPESPRWLADKGRGDEAAAIVARFEARARELGKSLPAPEIVTRSGDRTTRFSELFQGIYLKRTMLGWSLFFATYFVSYGLSIWIPTLFVKLGGLPASYALVLTVIGGAIHLGFVFLWGNVADWIGRRRSFILGYSLSILGLAIGVFSIFVLKSAGWQMLFLSSLIAGLGTNFTAALCFLYNSELFPTRMRAWGTSTGSTVSRVGSFIAPTAVGALLDAQLGVTSVYIMFAAVNCLGLLAIVTLGPETSKGGLEEVSA